jgi:hypothetical protein
MRMRRVSWLMASSSSQLTNLSNGHTGIRERRKLNSLNFNYCPWHNVHMKFNGNPSRQFLVLNVYMRVSPVAGLRYCGLG